MKKTFLLLVLIFISVNGKLIACAEYYGNDVMYYNLFVQEIIEDPQYYPFLLSLDYAYYDSKEAVKDENIEEWQRYLETDYEQTCYLVYRASKEDIDQLLSGKSAGKELDFMTPSRVKKYKQALLYLSYAKYLEPYMMISGVDSFGWNYYQPEFTADKLDYKKVVSVLERSWKAESDKELKLRYGFQLVRFAHYNRNYDEAVRFFDTYVEPLDYKPAMYYRALSQKAGAEKGTGDVMTANADFFQVFAHSENLKKSALTSIRFGDNADFKDFLERAKTKKEKNDAYLLLGYIDFNNPLNEIKKITAESPDAIQSKVLMARAVNTLEREILPMYCYRDAPGKYGKEKDKRYPVIKGDKLKNFFDSALRISIQMADSKDVKDKDFWNITTAYLFFLDKNFSDAKKYLDLVKNADEKYVLQKKNLAMYIDLCGLPEITGKVEAYLYENYKDVLTQSVDFNFDFYDQDNQKSYLQYSTQNFIMDMLANRYFLQKDYAKSFLLNNDITVLESNPRLDLLADIESFYRKPGKNAWEKYIENKMFTKETGRINIQNYIYYLRGIIYLSQGDYAKASETFNQAGYLPYDTIPAKIFGYNKIECYECNEEKVMRNDYLSDFPFIKENMNEKELAGALVELWKKGQKNDELSAKAGYLIGNFIYNTTSTGYYRHVLRFDATNGNGEKFRVQERTDVYDDIYFKYYPMYYDNPVRLSQQYLEKALNTSKDDELKAQILFALSKCEQEMHNEKINGFCYDIDGDNILIKGRVFFKELSKYGKTRFYDEVVTNCKYFDYYVSHYL